MWPHQGPPPPLGSTSPVYPPSYSSQYLPAAPVAFPQPPQPSYPAGQYPVGQYPTYQYPGMAPNLHPGSMPYGVPPGGYTYPAAPGGYPHVSPACVHPGPFPHSPKGHHIPGHKDHHHHHGFPPVSGGLLAGVGAVGMMLLGHKAQKKMKKKMKKVHKGHKYWHGKHSSSSSSSDSD